MAEIELSDIPGDAVRASLCETIEKELNSKQYIIEITPASKVGENNFMGIVYRATFHKEGENDRKSKLILKTAPQNAVRRTQFFARPAFLREIYIYDTVLPYFREFEQSKGVVIKEHAFVEYPKCYRTVDDDVQESLVLEDMSVHNFRMIDKQNEVLTSDHVNLVMIALAKFHAISFAVQDQQPNKFDELVSKMDEIYLRRHDVFLPEFFRNQAKAIPEVLSDEKDAHLLERVKKLLEREPIDITIDSVSAEHGGVITHGDCSIHNTLFNFDSNGKPVEVSLLDWQIARYSSPILDLTYFIFCCTTKELRDVHYDNFLKVYHETLSAHMRRLGSDPDKIFPYSKMLDHFRKFARYALIMATQLVPLITREAGNKVDLDKAANNMDKLDNVDIYGSVSENSLKKYHKHLRDVIIDMVRLEYI